MRMMKAARLHTIGAPMQIDTLPVPQPSDNDVLVRIHACGIVPNLANILNHWPSWFPNLPLPRLPAIFGLDPAGEIVAVGRHVQYWNVGDRVYVNPGRYCGGCRACRSNETVNCEAYALGGYIGSCAKSIKLFENHPYGGLCEFMTAPQYALVKLPDNVSYDQAARFGYLGTMYSALRKGGAAPGTTVLVNGISGTLGIGAVLIGAAMGVTRILGTGRDKALLAEIKALAPDRVETFSTTDGAIDEWVLARSEGAGVDIFIDAMGPGADHETFRQGIRSLRRGGHAYNIGAISGPVGIDLHDIMDQGQRIEGSSWFTAGEGQVMAEMTAAGTLDLSIFEHVKYPLEKINEAISGISTRHGGFTNFVINPVDAWETLPV